MKVNYQELYETENKASLERARKGLKKPKEVFTLGDLQHASPEKLDRMIKRLVKG